MFVQVAVEPGTDLREYITTLECIPERTQHHSFVCTVKLAHPKNERSQLSPSPVRFFLTQKKACCCHSKAPPLPCLVCAGLRPATLNPRPKPRNPSWTPQNSFLSFRLTSIFCSPAPLDSCATATPGCRRAQRPAIHNVHPPTLPRSLRSTPNDYNGKTTIDLSYRSQDHRI